MAGAIIGGLLGGVGPAIAGALSGGVQGKAATDRRIREQYQTLVKDLEKAGLNPALAYGAANASTSATGTALESRLPADLAGGVASGTSAYAAGKKLHHETKLLKAQARETNARAEITESGKWKASAQGTAWKQGAKAIGGLDKGVTATGLWDKFNAWITGEPSSAAPPQPPPVLKPVPKYRMNQDTNKRRPTR